MQIWLSVKKLKVVDDIFEVGYIFLYGKKYEETAMEIHASKIYSTLCGNPVVPHSQDKGLQYINFRYMRQKRFSAYITRI